jgi:transcriptional antiterminator
MKTTGGLKKSTDKNSGLSKRQMEEVLFLLKLEGKVLTEGELAKNFNISRKTAEKDVDKIVTFFASRGINFEVKPKKGIILKKVPRDKRISVANEIEKKLRNEKKLNKTERFYLILAHCLLTNKIPTIEDWSEKLNVSRTTAIKDIKEVKQWLKNENLELIGKSGVGFKLVGKEKAIRDALVDFLLSILFQNGSYPSALRQEKSSLTSILNEFNLEILSNAYSFEIRNFVHKLENKLGTTLLYEDFMKFLLYVSVSLRRIREDKCINVTSQEIADITNKPLYNSIKENISQLCKTYKTGITQEEIVYITERFMTLRFHSEPRLFSIFGIYEKAVDIYAKYLAESAEEILGIPFLKDEEFVQLVSAHLRMFFGKVSYGIKITNPFFEEIKSNCPLLLKVSERICMECAEKFRIKILNHESQCIALYLLEEIEKMDHKRRKRIAVLCPQSMAITHFLKWKLKNDIPEVEVVIAKSCIKENRVNDSKFLDNVDLILSTSPIPLTKTPTLIIPRFLSEKYIEKIKKLLNIDQIGRNDFYDERLLLKNENFVFSFELSSNKKDKFTKDLAKELYKRGYVRKDATRELLKAGITFLEEPHSFALTYASAKIGVKPGVAIISTNREAKTKRATNTKDFIKNKTVIVPIFVSNKETSLKVLKVFKYLITNNFGRL